jgi:(2R)-3-sulfolactate dehydrogenase (NADP+)
LIDAELEGQGSHGLIRLPFLLRRLRDGYIDATPRMELSGTGGAALLLDAGNGLGPVAGARAVDLAGERARERGLGLVAVRRSNHLGALGFYLHRCTDRGLVGMAMSNTPPAIAPPGASVPYLGTNPIAAGFPTSGEPVLVDMATSQVARGRILKAARSGEAIPEGWALDSEGAPTSDPDAALAGSLIGLGGEKGFALALMVEMLTGALAGSAIGPDVGGTYAASDRPSDVGHCFVAIDPGAIAPGFVERADRIVADLRQLGGRAPGDRRHAERARRLSEGIDLPDSLVAEIAALGDVGAPAG